MLTSDPGLPGGPTGPGSPSAPWKQKNVAMFTFLTIYGIIIYVVEENGYESWQTSNIKTTRGAAVYVGSFLMVFFFFFCSYIVIQ